MAIKSRSLKKLNSNLAGVIVEHIMANVYSAKIKEVEVLGVGINTIRVIDDFSGKDIQVLKELSEFYISPDAKFNAKGFEGAVDVLVNRRSEDKLKDIALKMGACSSMMRSLFGMHATECAERRSVLNIVSKTGRARLPSDIEKKAIHKSWNECKDLRESELFITISEKTGIPLNIIWTYYNSENFEWEKEVELPISDRKVGKYK